MATAGEIASASLKRILVEADEAPLEASEYADFLDAMNAYMAALEADGVVLGYEPVSNVNDTVTVPDGALRGMIANLAIEVNSDYGGQVTPSLGKQAEQGYRTMLKLGRPKKQTTLPTSLPRGSGSWYETNRSSNYFGGDVVRVVSALDNTVDTTFSATDIPTRIKGWFKSRSMKGMQAFITGRVLNDNDATMDVEYRFSGTVSGLGGYTFYLLRSNEVVTSKTFAFDPNAYDVELTAKVALQPGDWLEVWVENDIDTQLLSMRRAFIEVY